MKTSRGGSKKSIFRNDNNLQEMRMHSLIGILRNEEVVAATVGIAYKDMFRQNDMEDASEDVYLIGLK